MTLRNPDTKRGAISEYELGSRQAQADIIISLDWAFTWMSEREESLFYKIGLQVKVA